MSFKAGRNARVYFNEVDLSPYLHQADLSVTQENGDTTTFANAPWSTAIALVQSGTLGFEGYYDPALTQLPAALGVDSGVLTSCPAGGALGDLCRMALITATAYSETDAANGVVAIGWDTLAEGPIVAGKVMHAMAEDTNTTTGSSIDDSAATSTGWWAHLHVTAVDGGSWVVKLQHSTDNSSWSDVTGGAFSAKTAAGYERLRSAASTTTLNRYRRYVATRTGGSGGDGITFLLALSRTNP